MSEPMITSPITWQMLERVRDALKLIQPGNGYLTDIGLQVVALEGDQLPEDEAPYTLVVATDIAVSEDTSAQSRIHSEMTIVIECAVPFAVGASSQLAAHRARFDLIRALLPLRKNGRARPLYITSFSIVDSLIGQPEGGASVVIAQVTARAGLVESLLPANS